MGLRGWGFGGAWFLGLGCGSCGFFVGFLVGELLLLGNWLFGLFSTSEEGWRYLGYGFILYGGHGMRTKESSSTIHLTLSLTDVT